MKTARSILILVTLISSLGCSNRWREANTQLSDQEMLAMLNEVGSAQSASAGDSTVTSILALKDSTATTIFFADAPGPMGPVQGVLAFEELSAFGADQTFKMSDLTKARIFFLDNLSDAGHKDGLILGLASSSSTDLTYYGFIGQGDVNGNEFSAQLSDSSGHQIIVRSYDVSGGDLQGVIQLRVYTQDASGNETYVGKITTLAGYQQ